MSVDASKSYRRTRHGHIVSFIKMSFVIRFVHTLMTLMASHRLCGTISKSGTRVQGVLSAIVQRSFFLFHLSISIPVHHSISKHTPKDSSKVSHCNYLSASYSPNIARKPKPSHVVNQHVIPPLQPNGKSRSFGVHLRQFRCVLQNF